MTIEYKKFVVSFASMISVYKDSTIPTDESWCQNFVFTIGELIQLYEENSLVFNRAHQRDEVTEDKWKRDLVATVLFSNDSQIPGIHIRFNEKTLKFEVIDGQQRLTALRKFFDNELTIKKDRQAFETRDFDGFTTGSTYQETIEINPDFEKHFKSYEINATMYFNYSDAQVTDLFIYKLNNTTGLNKQEKRNAILGPVSDLIRDWARPLLGHDPHPIFERKFGKQSLKYIDLNDTRMQIDEFFAKYVYMFETNGWRWTHPELDSFYRTTQQGVGAPYASKYTNVRRLDKTLKYCLKFLKEMERQLPAGKRGERKATFVLWMMRMIEKIQEKECFVLTYKGREVKGTLYILDIPKFTRKLLEWYREGKLDYEYKGVLPPHQSVSEPFGQIGEYPGLFNCFVKYIQNDVQTNNNESDWGISIRDSRRTFTDKTKAKILKKQDYKDPYDGEELTLATAQGDHIIPISDGILAGGITVPSNCQMISKSNNLVKSTKSHEDFKRRIA